MKKQSEYNETVMVNITRNNSLRPVILNSIHGDDINVNPNELNQQNASSSCISSSNEQILSFPSNFSHNASIRQDVEMISVYNDENGIIPPVTHPMQSSVPLQAKGTIVTHDDEYLLTPQQVFQALSIWNNGYGSISEQTHLSNSAILISEQFDNHQITTDTTNVYQNHPYENTAPITYYGHTRGCSEYNTNVRYSPYSHQRVRQASISIPSPLPSFGQTSSSKSDSSLDNRLHTQTEIVPVCLTLPQIYDEDDLSIACTLPTTFRNSNGEINGFDDESMFQLFPFIPIDNQSCITGFN